MSQPSDGSKYWLPRGLKFEAGDQLVVPGKSEWIATITSGWVCETFSYGEGRRQIVLFDLPGDTIEIKQSLGQSANLMALSRLELTQRSDGAEAEPRGEAINEIKFGMLSRRANRLREHVVRLGSLSAAERVIDLLLEFHGRLSAIGLVRDGSFRLPLTQAHFADALGMSLIHVSRILKDLRSRRLVTIGAGRATLHDPQRLHNLLSGSMLNSAHSEAH